MKEMRACCVCGTLHLVEELTEFDDSYLCESCLHTETTRCQRCGERIWTDDNSGDSNTPLCQSCYDRYYTSCEDCGRTISYDEAYYQDDDDDQYEPRCYSCHCRHTDHQVIHDYYYKPTVLFFHTSKEAAPCRYFGLELEIDCAGEDETHARRLSDIANASADHLYIKHDGSLDSGMELVSHAMTRAYHETVMPWKEILSAAKNMGYRSHQAGTCGLHVHVNRTAFGETEAEQDDVIARVLFFFEKHWEELLKFSRRTPRQLKKWADRYGYKDHPKEILDHAKGNEERYTCVNLTNTNTIEFRIFRGSLKYTTLIATIQLLDRICDVALYFSDEEIKAMSWTTFVAGCAHLSELTQYLRERRIFVNDPVATEEEV